MPARGGGPGYEGGLGQDTFVRLGELRCPVHRGGHRRRGPRPGRLRAAAVEALPLGRLDRFGDLSHFGPMAGPAAMAEALRAEGLNG